MRESFRHMNAFKSVRMHTVLLPMCPTDGPMARGAREGTSLGGLNIHV